MHRKLLAVLLGATSVFLLLGFRQTVPAGEKPEYTSDSQLRFPEHYREWVFLSAGFDMSYSEATQTDRHTFDNVFASPQAYQSFLKTGTWPDKTMLVFESRRANSKGSINKAGNYQDSEVVGLSVHVKDGSRFPTNWAFFTFDAAKNSKLQPPTADCYSCHAASGAVDTTFVQFYPTLLPIAKSNGTLSPAYQRENTP
jgi:cytochrome P460